jgi:hypothetical protein
MGVMLVHTLRLPDRSRPHVGFAARAAAARRPAVAWSQRRRELVGRCVLGAVMLASRVAMRIDDAFAGGRPRLEP